MYYYHPYAQALPRATLSQADVAQIARLPLVKQVRQGATAAVLAGLERSDLSAIAAGLNNDFQQVLPEGSSIPVIVEALRQLGALNAQMTGSGSAVFGLFHRREDAEVAASVLKEDYPQTFCVPQV